jgi:hypothetical protein
VWIIDPVAAGEAAKAGAQAVSPFTDLWHTVLLAVGVWLGKVLHGMTHGGD